MRGKVSDEIRGARVIAFDVNETLLDLSGLDVVFEEALGSAALRGPWFAQTLQLGFVGSITDRYVDFTTAQHAALTMVAEREGIELERETADRIVSGMRTLRAHPDVRDALARLRAGGLRLAALTNSPLDVAREQLRHAGLDDRFDEILSADQVHALKPRREPYELVARVFDVPLGDVRLVAAHSWDTAGALAAGCSAAFVERPGMVLSPLGAQPDIVGADVGDVADAILKRLGE